MVVCLSRYLYTLYHMCESGFIGTTVDFVFTNVSISVTSSPIFAFKRIAIGILFEIGMYGTDRRGDS